MTTALQLCDSANTIKTITTQNFYIYSLQLPKPFHSPLSSQRKVLLFRKVYGLSQVRIAVDPDVVSRKLKVPPVTASGSPQSTSTVRRKRKQSIVVTIELLSTLW